MKCASPMSSAKDCTTRSGSYAPSSSAKNLLTTSHSALPILAKAMSRSPLCIVPAHSFSQPTRFHCRGAIYGQESNKEEERRPRSHDDPHRESDLFEGAIRRSGQ